MSDYTPYIYLTFNQRKTTKMKKKIIIIKNEKNNHENGQVSTIFGIFSSFVYI